MGTDRDEIVPDVADAYALLDNGEIKSSRCPHCCNWICTCDDPEADEARRRYRRMVSGERPKRWVD